MVSCRDIHRRIARHETPSSAAERAHLYTCEPCRLMLADDAHLGRAMVEVAQERLDLVGIHDAVRGEIALEAGPVAFLRSRPTPVRLALVAGLTALVAVIVLWMMPRVDLGLYPLPRMAWVMALLLAPLMVAFGVVLWPLQRRALARIPVWSGFAAAVLAPGFIALSPRAHALHPETLRGDGGELFPLALRCLAFGIATGLPLLLALWAFDRGAHAALPRAVVAAAAAGLLGNLALQLHCPITTPVHLLLGHATVGLVFVGAYLIAAVRGQKL